MEMKTFVCPEFLILVFTWSTFSVRSILLKDEMDKPHYTEAHYRLHRLVQTTTHSHLQDFEIAVPSFVDVDDLLHHRYRRDLSSESNQPTFKISSHGHNFHVTLTPNARLISDDFSVRRIRRDLVTGDLVEEDGNSKVLYCHHYGVMRSHENRTTAISTCGGLYGLLRTESDDFIIEPVPHHLENDFPSSQQPHIIYKKKDLTKHGELLHFCGKQKRRPISTSISDIVEIKELSSGQMIIVRESDKTRENVRGKFSRKRLKRGDPRRHRKSDRIVETLVVADRQLIENHRSDKLDVTTYVLTVMNMASSLYKDSTLDEQIDIVLIGLVLLEDDEELHLDHRADKSLANFCRWQAKANTTTGRKPDHSILLTGINICNDRNEPCETLGLAQIGGMCSLTDSCTINEDTGLGLAFTVAHETGHSFGMKHDGQGNSCGKRDGHIMSSSLNTINGIFTWSACSRRSMANFFTTSRSRCLDNKPALVDVTFPDELPGQQYNASTQCRLQFGARASFCVNRHLNDMKSICKALWCAKADVCTTKNMPAAEGTSCGLQKWCRRGECVDHGSPGPNPETGGWSKYGPWSDCSRTCGGGISWRQRFCNEPSPRFGGRYCEGGDKIYQICNRYKCPPGTPSYRAQQCAEYNSQPYRRQYLNWIPFKKYWKYEINRCELLCEADGYRFFDRLSFQVKDGTMCDDDSDDVCIEGKCVHVGCDYILYSNATVDACGVCNGDNSTCSFMTGTYNTSIHDSGYYHVVKIPEGARTISIWEEQCCTRTFIAVRSATNTSRYFLNGNWMIDLYGEHRFVGAVWHYEKQSSQTTILWTAGPLKKDVTIEALIGGKNPGVSYSFAIKEIDNTLSHDSLEKPLHTYSWEANFSPCSKSCAGGVQERTTGCLEDGKYAVNDSYCDGITRPGKRIRECNTHPCPAKWVAGKWGKCSRTCGGGIQIRRISCQRGPRNESTHASMNECNLSKKPSRNQICARNDCAPEWKKTRWSRCSRTCGRGVRTRSIYCKSGMQKLTENRCDRLSKPIFRQACSVAYCRRKFQWSLSKFTSCSATCGEGQQYRSHRCTFRERRGKIRPVNPKRCRQVKKTNATLTKACLMPVCASNMTKMRVNSSIENISRRVANDNKNHHNTKTRHQEATWVSSTWQPCTATCGGGNQVRVVKCMQNGKPSVACSYDNKPPYVRSCNTNSCTVVEEVCVDAHTWCHLVPHHNTCTHVYFGKQCCKSCEKRSKSRSFRK